jgi:hypothetical protein
VSDCLTCGHAAEVHGLAHCNMTDCECSAPGYVGREAAAVNVRLWGGVKYFVLDDPDDDYEARCVVDHNVEVYHP